MNAFIALALIGVVLWKWKNNFSKRIALQYEFKLKDIRSKLAIYAIDAHLQPHDKRYKNLDDTMVNTIKILPSLNFFLILVYVLFKKKEDDAAKKNVPPHTTPTKSIKDRKIDFELLKIQKEFNHIVYTYLLHSTVILLLFAYLVIWFKPFRNLINKMKISIRDSIFSPTTNEFKFPLALS